MAEKQKRSTTSSLWLVVLGLGGIAFLLSGGWFLWQARTGQQDPQKAQHAYEEGQAQLAKKEYLTAYSLFQEAVREKPDHAAYRWALARLALALDVKRTAWEHSRAAWELGLRDTDVVQAIIRADTRDRRVVVKDALARFEALPNTPETRIVKGQVLYDFGQYEDAIRIWLDVFTQTPTASLAQSLSKAYLNIGDDAKAIDLLETFSQSGTLTPQSIGTLAYLYLQQDRFAETERLLTQAITTHPADLALRIRLGRFYYADGQAQKAYALLRDGLALQPEAPQPETRALQHTARMDCACYVFASGEEAQEIEQALRHLRGMVTGAGARFEGEQALYDALTQWARTGTPSLDTLGKASALLQDPPLPVFEMLYGQALLEAGQSRNAITAFNKVAVGDAALRGSPVFLLQFAYAYAQSQQVSEAIALLNAMHARGQSTRGSLILYRDLLIRQGFLESARQAQALLQTEAADVVAVRRGGYRLQALAGAFPQALKQCEALIAAYPARSELRLDRLQILLAMRRYDDVLAACADASLSERVRLSLKARAYHGKGARARAATAYLQALAISPDVDLQTGYAQLLLEQGALSEALSAAQQALSIFPEHTPANRIAGEVLLRQGQAETAEPYAEAAANASPDNPATQLLLAQVAAALGRIEEAVVRARHASTLAPDDTRYAYALLQILLRAKQYTDASAVVDSLLQADARDGVALRAGVLIAEATHDPAQGLAYAATLLQQTSDDLDVRKAQVRLLGEAKRFSTARAKLSALQSALTPTDYAILSAWIAERDMGPAAAMDILQKATPDPVIRTELALLMLRSNRREGVIELLQKDVRPVHIWALLAQRAEAEQRWDVAVYALEQALDTRPDDWPLLNNLAWYYLQLGADHLPAARATAQKAYTLAPQNAAVLDTYTEILYRAEAWRSLADILSGARLQTDASPRLLLRLAEASAALGERERALEAYETLLAIPALDTLAQDLPVSLDTIRQRVRDLTHE